MYKETPIICPHCGRESGYTKEGIMFLVLTCDLLCQFCGKIVIHANQVRWRKNGIR